MINKERILKVDIYNNQGNRLITSTSITFPKDFFSIRGQELVVIKAKDLPEIDKEEPIVAIFEYLNGDRMKYDTKVDLCTEYQLNFHVATGQLLEERRNSFKLNVEFEGKCSFYERGEEDTAPIVFEKPLTLYFHNINLGGVLFECDYDFMPKDRINLSFLNGNIELMGEILRTQLDANGNKIGYGCKFLNVKQFQEEKIAKFILDCQVAEREKRRSNGF